MYSTTKATLNAPLLHKVLELNPNINYLIHSHEIIGKNIVNTVILGALAKNSNLFSITALKKAVTEKFSDKGKTILQKNIAAILKIYESSAKNR